MLTARRAAAAGALIALLSAAPAGAARPVSIAAPPEEPVATLPLLLDAIADVPVRGRAAPRAVVDVSAPCSLRICATRVTANRKGRWRARLHVIVPPRRATAVVSAAYPGGVPVTTEVPLAPPAVMPGAPELVMIGDSLAQGTAPYLPELLPGWRVTADAARSRFLFTGMVVRDTMRKPPSRPVVLAFSLFTNDDPSRAPDLEAAVRRSLDGLPRGSCALWATIARPRVGGVSYAAANRTLEALADELPGVVVVPWAKAARRHPRWLREDRVHATDEGYRARAELYATAARTCGGVRQ